MSDASASLPMSDRQTSSTSQADDLHQGGALRKGASRAFGGSAPRRERSAITLDVTRNVTRIAFDCRTLEMGVDESGASEARRRPSNTPPPESILPASTDARHLPLEPAILDYRKAGIFSCRLQQKKSTALIPFPPIVPSSHGIEKRRSSRHFIRFQHAANALLISPARNRWYSSSSASPF
jgi:hypothetical protein